MLRELLSTDMGGCVVFNPTLLTILKLGQNHHLWCQLNPVSTVLRQKDPSLQNQTADTKQKPSSPTESSGTSSCKKSNSQAKEAGPPPPFKPPPPPKATP
jgi:hypothetical protein